MTKAAEQKERKPKRAAIIMVKVGKFGEVDTYAPLDADGAKVLGGRRSFESSIPVAGRSLGQNALWAVWYPRIAKYTGTTAEEAKCECKLLYGVPILLAEDKTFRRVWQAKFSNDTYEQQKFMMRYLPVTSLLNRGQGTIYTESLQREYSKQGLLLEII